MVKPADHRSVQPHLVASSRRHDQRVGAVEPAGNADDQAFGLRRLHPPHQPVDLDVERFVTIFVQFPLPIGHEGEPANRPNQIALRSLHRVERNRRGTCLQAAPPPPPRRYRFASACVRPGYDRNRHRRCTIPPPARTVRFRPADRPVRRSFPARPRRDRSCFRHGRWRNRHRRPRIGWIARATANAVRPTCRSLCWMRTDWPGSLPRPAPP